MWFCLFLDLTGGDDMHIEKVLNNNAFISLDKDGEEIIVMGRGIAFGKKGNQDVDLSNFKVNIFKGTKNNWKLDKSYLCTIGKNSTPTPSGVFKIGVKGLYFGVEKGYKCWYYSSFKGNYLFHSIIYNLDGTVRDGRLGMKLSNGCIRLLKTNAKYIYDNVPKDTKVIIN